MQYTQLNYDGPVAVLTLQRPKANAIHAAMLEELHAAVAEVANNNAARALVLASGMPRFFSSGLDVLEVFAYDRPRLTDFFGRFMELYEALARMPKPVVGAISGHAYAGGAILALACDFRIMAEGDFGFALNEINLGVVLPPGVLRMLVQAVGHAATREIVLTGDALKPAKALQIGLARELAPAESVQERAVAFAKILAEKPSTPMAALKSMLRSLTPQAHTNLERLGLEDFVDHWFAPDSVQRRHALVEGLKK